MYAKEYSYFKTAILVNLCTNFDGVIISRKILGTIFAKNFLIAWRVGLNINKLKNLPIFIKKIP